MREGPAPGDWHINGWHEDDTKVCRCKGVNDVGQETPLASLIAILNRESSGRSQLSRNAVLSWSSRRRVRRAAAAYLSDSQQLRGEWNLAK